MLDLNALDLDLVPLYPPCPEQPHVSHVWGNTATKAQKSPAVSFSHSDCSQNKNEFFHGNLQLPRLDTEATGNF